VKEWELSNMRIDAAVRFPLAAFDSNNPAADGDILRRASELQFVVVGSFHVAD
jgi:hypothetical protein